VGLVRQGDRYGLVVICSTWPNIVSIKSWTVGRRKPGTRTLMETFDARLISGLARLQ